MLSEINQTEKHKYYMISHIYTKEHTNITKYNRLIGI